MSLGHHTNKDLSDSMLRRLLHWGEVGSEEDPEGVMQGSNATRLLPSSNRVTDGMMRASSSG